MPVVIFIVLGVLIFIIVILGFIRHILDRRREQIHSELSGGFCEYSVTGGMENEYLVVRVSYKSLDEAELTVEKCDDGSEKKETVTKLVPFEALYSLFEIFDDCEMDKWGSLPQAEEQALDAPTRMVTFRTSKEEYSFTSDQELPVADIFSRLTTILRQYTDAV